MNPNKIFLRNMNMMTSNRLTTTPKSEAWAVIS